MANKKVVKEILEDDIIEETPAEDLLVDEEEVQAVANAIVEEAEENNKTVEEVVNEIVEESKDDVDKLVAGRGFNSYKDAVEFAQTEAFKKLHKADQEEFNSWLKSLK